MSRPSQIPPAKAAPQAWGPSELGPLDLADIAESLIRTSSFDELAHAYHAAGERLVALPMRALYIFDPETGGTEYISSVNVSDSFVARYERMGREIDPVLMHALKSKRPAYNLDLMSLDEWVRTECYRAVSRLHQIHHVVETPVIVDGEIAGMLNFGTDDPARSISPGEIELMMVLARLIGAVVADRRQRQLQSREALQLRAALDACPSAVAVFDPEQAEPLLNEAARALVARIDGGADILYRLAARPSYGHDGFSRTVEVRLRGGGPALLRAHTAPAREAELIMVSVLALEGGPPMLAGPSWSALSPREREVTQLVVDGLTDREIAERLVLSPHTVRQHVKRIYGKVGVRSRVELARLVLGSHLRDPREIT